MEAEAVGKTRLKHYVPTTVAKKNGEGKGGKRRWEF